METTPSFSNYLDMDTALAYAHKTDSRINENSKQIFEIKDEMTAMKNEHSRNKWAHERDAEEIWAILKNAAKLSEETKLINKENAARMKETDKRMNQLFNKIGEENAARMKETDKRMNLLFNKIDKENAARMKETDKRMNLLFNKIDKENAARMKETDKRMNLLFNKIDEENAARMKETDKRMNQLFNKIGEENAARMKETDKRMNLLFNKIDEENAGRMKENDKMIEEIGKQMKETDQKIKELSARFNSTVGNIMEGLMRPSSFKIFKKAGFSINRCLRNMKRKNKEPLLAMELDALMIGDTEIIVLEVKSSCDCNDIDKFLFHMQRFRTLFPEYDKLNLNVYVAIASLNYENEADLYAQKQGLLVIRVSEEEIFTLDPFDNQNLRIF